LIDWCLTPTLAVFQVYRGVLSQETGKLEMHFVILIMHYQLIYTNVFL